MDRISAALSQNDSGRWAWQPMHAIAMHAGSAGDVARTQPSFRFGNLRDLITMISLAEEIRSAIRSLEALVGRVDVENRARRNILKLLHRKVRSVSRETI